MTEEYITISALAKRLIVDERTLKKGIKKLGMRIIYLGPRCPRLSANDAEKLMRDGLPYYNDKIKPTKR